MINKDNYKNSSDKISLPDKYRGYEVEVERLQKVVDETKEKLAVLAIKNERLRNNAKYDKIARDGQLKRSRVLEHELNEIKHDNDVQKRLRDEANKREKAAMAALRRERATLLQDMHEKGKIRKEKERAEQSERSCQEKKLEYAQKVDSLASHLSGLQSAIQSQNTIITESNDEAKLTYTEIANIRRENNSLKQKLQERKADVLHHMNSRAELEKECHGLRTELIQSTQSIARFSISPHKIRRSQNSLPLKFTSSLAMEKIKKIKPRAIYCKKSITQALYIEDGLTLQEVAMCVKLDKNSAKHSVSTPITNDCIDGNEQSSNQSISKSKSKRRKN